MGWLSLLNIALQLPLVLRTFVHFTNGYPYMQSLSHQFPSFSSSRSLNCDPFCTHMGGGTTISDSLFYTTLHSRREGITPSLSPYLPPARPPGVPPPFALRPPRWPPRWHATGHPHGIPRATPRPPVWLPNPRSNRGLALPSPLPSLPATPQLPPGYPPATPRHTTGTPREHPLTPAAQPGAG